ncbi:phosphohydrolase [Pseudomonas nitroreducens]|uniref:phosphohydrolase n=1 Tax=Pseudomonas nitroreducens TaxID=46680 RepID=UPI002658718A|nr:phosphohydrolase [Pseudomonas nitroreducens]MCP1646960.1 hypothetical protein [Pseudomonas nitroreducens]MCP1685536.1 hypothetical protein [Pseudomonas nitroreducens]
MTWILTWSGKRFDLFEPTPEMIDPRDIAQALGTIARFNGHTKEHYTVAQHSVIVANLVPPEHQLAALLHDATEAYIGDMVRPLKEHMPAFCEVEKRIWSTICARFDIDEELPACVKQADLVALATERRDLMPEHPAPWRCLEGIEPIAGRITLWSPHVSRWHFHDRLMGLLSSTHRAAHI